MRRALFSLMACALLLVALCPARAQEAANSLTPAQIAAQIKPLHPKTLVLVFDVSASTRTGGVFARERAATATLIRQGCVPGDRVALLAFGTGYATVFDKTLMDAADASAMIDELPASVSPGQGTNIRWPHHEALRLIDADLPHPGVVVLLTNSFNDRPLTTDPNYPQYLAYYKLNALTSYPDTPANADYERLLRTLKARGKLREYGVGVGIARTGRPIERLPLAPGQDDAAGGPVNSAPVVLSPVGTEKPQSQWPLFVGSGIALLLVLMGAGWLMLNRPVPLRLSLGERSAPRDFRLRPGAKVGLGGSPVSAAPGDDVFPLAGLSAPCAFVRGERGGALSLFPAPQAAPDVLCFHNGLRLESPVPLRVGDEIRVTLPATESAPAREHRVHVQDPSASLL